MFTFEFFDWEDFRQWLFIGSSQIPAASGFKWVEDRSKVYGGVRHSVLKPSPKEDNRWKLHQYSSLDPMENAIYVMYCNKVDEPLSGQSVLVYLTVVCSFICHVLLLLLLLLYNSHVLSFGNLAPEEDEEDEEDEESDSD